MSMLLLAVALVQADAAAPDLHETTREAFGRFVVEHERYERRGTPIMHVASRWQKVRLFWASSDGKVVMRLEDDGDAVAQRDAVDFVLHGAGVGIDKDTDGGHPASLQHRSAKAKRLTPVAAPA